MRKLGEMRQALKAQGNQSNCVSVKRGGSPTVREGARFPLGSSNDADDSFSSFLMLRSVCSEPISGLST